MSQPTQDQKIFKLILRSIASDNLSPDDYKVALSDLRDGRLVGILDEVLTALSIPQRNEKVPRSKKLSKPSKKKKNGSAHSIKGVDQLFNDIKRRKITRNRVEEILGSLDTDFANQAGNASTILDLVRSYYSHATERQWELFSAIVNGDYEVDPYLRDMSTT